MTGGAHSLSVAAIKAGHVLVGTLLPESSGVCNVKQQAHTALDGAVAVAAI